MRHLRWILPAGVAIGLSGCAVALSPIVEGFVVPASENLYQPDRVEPGRLEYAPDDSTFAPVLTERFAYPTQEQAVKALWRYFAQASPEVRVFSGVRLFGCKPGAFDARTGRVVRYRGPVVHCATDFLDAGGTPLRREAVNFYYYRSSWNMQIVDPLKSPVAWRERESSPKDFWRWVPWRDRYE